MDWILANWQGLLGGGSLTTMITYIVNRNSNKADLLTKVSGLYDSLFDDIKLAKEELKTSNEELKQINKEYNSDIRELRKAQDSLQSQFNDLNIAYTREVEKSQYWMQKYDDIDKKYNELLTKHNEVIKQNEHLEELCETLKKEHELLKQEFEQYKKAKK